MPKKEYKLGYIATEKNGSHPAGSVIKNDYIKDEWVSEGRLLEELKTYNPATGFLYTPTVLETRYVPTEEEIRKAENITRSKIIAAMGYNSENSMVDSLASLPNIDKVMGALKTLVEARKVQG